MPTTKRSSRWTPAQAGALLIGIGAYGRDWFKRKTGRTIPAIMAQARKRYGTASLTRGTWSLRKAMAETGYSRSQLLRAQSALGQKWRRTSARGRYIISEEQLRELTDWLVHDYWSTSKSLYNCLWCTTTERPTYAIGLCRSCYKAHARRAHSLGVPVALCGQRQFVLALQAEGVESDVFWRPALARLEMGIALDFRQLTTLGRLAQSLETSGGAARGHGDGSVCRSGGGLVVVDEPDEGRDADGVEEGS